MITLPTWLEEILAYVLVYVSIAFGIGLVWLVVIAVKYPATFISEYPDRDCALALINDKFHAPANSWVRISLSTEGYDNDLPTIYVNNVVPTQHTSAMRASIGWKPAVKSDKQIRDDEFIVKQWVIEYYIPPNKWLQVAASPVPPITIYQLRNRHMDLIPKNYSKISVNWVCASPLLTFAFFLELIGITLALLDFTGQVKRLERFLDRGRGKYSRWLFPGHKNKILVKSEGPFNEDLTKVDDGFSLTTISILFVGFVLGMFFIAIDSSQGSVSILKAFLVISGITLLLFVLRFLAKWILGSLIWLLWAVLDKTPAGTVGGIGFSLLIYGLVSEYIF